MSSLKRPMIWVYFLLFSYTLLSSIIWIITGPSSITSKLLLTLLLCILIVVYVVLFYRYSFKKLDSMDSTLQFILVGCFVLMGFVWMIFGGHSLYIQLTSPPLIYEYVWQEWMNVTVFAQLPFGFLIFILSILSLISSRKNKNLITQQPE